MLFSQRLQQLIDQNLRAVVRQKWEPRRSKKNLHLLCQARLGSARNNTSHAAIARNIRSHLTKAIQEKVAHGENARSTITAISFRSVLRLECPRSKRAQCSPDDMRNCQNPYRHRSDLPKEQQRIARHVIGIGRRGAPERCRNPMPNDCLWHVQNNTAGLLGSHTPLDVFKVEEVSFAERADAFY